MVNDTVGNLDAVAVAVGEDVGVGLTWPETSCAAPASPSWPVPFHPQQYAVPPDTRPHV